MCLGSWRILVLYSPSFNRANDSIHSWEKKTGMSSPVVSGPESPELRSPL